MSEATVSDHPHLLRYGGKDGNFFALLEPGGRLIVRAKGINFSWDSYGKWLYQEVGMSESSPWTVLEQVLGSKPEELKGVRLRSPGSVKGLDLCEGCGGVNIVKVSESGTTDNLECYDCGIITHVSSGRSDKEIGNQMARINPKTNKSVESAGDGDNSTATKPDPKKKTRKKSPKNEDAAEKSSSPRNTKKKSSTSPCLCGCGEIVAGRFRQGHDSRFHAAVKKLQDGRMTGKDVRKKYSAQMLKNIIAEHPSLASK